MQGSTQKLLRASAIAGAVAWEVSFFWRTSPLMETELINRILLLGVLVIVPLGLYVIAPDQSAQGSLLLRLAAMAQPFGAASVLASFFLKQGIAAAVLASVWLVVTTLISLYGLARLLSAPARTAAEISIGAGLIYLSVGSGWLIMARLGIQPLGFGDTIVLLTAVHFHYAGFAAPILTGLAGRRLVDGSRNIRRVFALLVLGVVAGTPLVATGITLSPALALAGTGIISLALAGFGVLVIGWVLPKIAARSIQFLLFISSASTFVSMTLASIYAYSIVARQLIIDIPQMAMTHGIVNAIGFSFCGLLAWSILRSHEDPA
jgi:hypothetical protein